ncbi:5' nucleotidase, NT5C type [Weissella bombi]|uniref:5' nucleotidase, deoxy (Pyrimidine), type C protein (NT5C) n=1 Tax=Weissella bombi TaxID=1505725 RepID=A0A1C4BEW4_9LACO|nr:hypothetical protein [Weissella bombi]SCC05272.1 5' nucleotidase, deoxy (Pyrimidine), type C protein (NT5C) [Weissella bombi]
MDNTLVNTLPILNAESENVQKYHVNKPDQIPGIFRDLKPLPGAVDGIFKLANYYDLYILSTAPWENPSSWQDKINWLTEYFGNDENSPFYKKVVLTHKKNLVKMPSSMLLDDRPYHGASDWDDKEIDSFWLQYGYDPRLVWTEDLVPFLISIAQSDEDSLRTDIIHANEKTQYKLRHATDEFKKESWEQ